MQLLPTLVTLSSLLTVALGQRYANAIHKTCDPYTLGDSIKWRDLGPLTQDDVWGNKASGFQQLQKWDHKRVINNRDNGYDYFWYGIYAGVVDATSLYAQIDRSGRGQGQQFKLDYKRGDGSVVVSYWMTPGVYCTAPLPAGTAWPDIASVQVLYRPKE